MKKITNKLFSLLMVFAIMLSNFLPFMPMIEVHAESNVLSVQISDGTNVNEFGDNELNVMNALNLKGLITLDEQTGEVRNQQSKLLFTVDNGIITLANDVSSEDNIEYTLTNEEKTGPFENIDKIYLKFKHTYTVIFQTNGGTEITPQIVDKNSTVNEPNSPTKQNYVFEGWYKNEELTQEYNFNMPVVSNFTLYAKWVAGLKVELSNGTNVNEFGDNELNVMNALNLKGLITLDEQTGEVRNQQSKLLFTVDNGIITLANDISSEDNIEYILTNEEKTGLFENIDKIYLRFNIPNVTYTVTFKDGTATLSTDTVNHGSTVTRPATNPTKSGYAFVNWYADAGLNIPFDFTNTTINSDTIIYAKWNKLITSASATITAPVGGKHPLFTAISGNSDAYSAIIDTWYDLNNNGAHLTNSDTFVAGNEYQARIHFTANDGYQFADSVTYTINGTPNYTTFDTAQQRGMNFTATAPATSQVTFNLNGGTMTGTNPQVVNNGENATKPATNPTYDGHVFAGWYADAGLNIPFDFTNTTINSDTIIYAKWDIAITTASATVTAPINGEHPDFNPVSGDSSLYTVIANAWYLHEAPYPTLTAESVYETGKGYSFRLTFTPKAGYQFTDDATFTVNGISTAKYGSIGDREYYAVASSPLTHKVSFDKNGGTGTMADVTGLSGTYTLPANGFTAPTNKQFKGWSLTSDGTIITTLEMTEDKTVYAIWEDIPVGTYTILEGNNQTYTKGSNTDIVIKASGDLAKINSIEIDGGNVIDPANYELTSGSTILTLKSSFLENSSIGQHTITIKYNDGEVDATLTVAETSNNNNNNNNNDNNNNGNTNTNTNINDNTNTNTNNNNTNNPQTSYDVVTYIYSLIFGIICFAGGSIYLKRKKLFGNK